MSLHFSLWCYMLYSSLSLLNLSIYTMKMNSWNFENSSNGFAMKNWPRNMCNRYYFTVINRGARNQLIFPYSFYCAGLRTRDPPLSPLSALAEIFRHPCLQSILQTSPPVPQKSNLMFQTPTTTPCRFSLKLGFCPPNLGFFGG